MQSLEHRELRIIQILAGLAHRDRCQLREHGRCARKPSGIHRILARWAAAKHCFIERGCCMGRKMCRNRGDLNHSTRLLGRVRWQARSHRRQGVAPTPTACGSNPAILGMHATSRRSSGPAQHEARILLGAGSGSSRTPFPRQATVRRPIKTRCASSPTS